MKNILFGLMSILVLIAGIGCGAKGANVSDTVHMDSGDNESEPSDSGFSQNEKEVDLSLHPDPLQEELIPVFGEYKLPTPRAPTEAHLESNFLSASLPQTRQAWS